MGVVRPREINPVRRGRARRECSRGKGRTGNNETMPEIGGEEPASSQPFGRRRRAGDSPGDTASVVFQGGAEEAAGADIHDVGEPGGNVGLAVAVVTPGDDGAVASENHAVKFTGRNGNDVIQSVRNSGSAIGVVAPGDDCPVAFQSQGVVMAG